MKKNLQTGAVMLVALLAAVLAHAGIRGDVDCNGRVDLKEAMHALRVTAGLDSESPAATDYDCDGFTEEQGDCNDYDPAIFPGAVDIPDDHIDQDCSGSAVDTVTSAGQVWMDRNLGASRVATSLTDAEAYGDLYQWGRGTDGHEKRDSPTTSTLSSSDTPGHGSFIVTGWNWRSPQNDNLWQGASGVNNPCPAGFRLPTDTELNTERVSWSSNNSAGAFNSPLKVVPAGYRYHYNGALYNVGSYGSYWSSTVDGSYARYLHFFSGYAHMDLNVRANGFSVRCLKD